MISKRGNCNVVKMHRQSLRIFFFGILSKPGTDYLTIKEVIFLTNKGPFFFQKEDDVYLFDFHILTNKLVLLLLCSRRFITRKSFFKVRDVSHGSPVSDALMFCLFLGKFPNKIFHNIFSTPEITFILPSAYFSNINNKMTSQTLYLILSKINIKRWPDTSF